MEKCRSVWGNMARSERDSRDAHLPVKSEGECRMAQPCWEARGSAYQLAIKRGFDIAAATLGILLTGWLILLAAAVARLDTGASGFFIQRRTGRYGRTFDIIKIRTMRESDAFSTTVTTSCDPRITKFGRMLRKTKIDELPQLINVFLGQMSFVGPRPDVPELAGRIRGDDLIVLAVRPGITGPATLKYRDEEEILARQPRPDEYNEQVIFPDKVSINKEYVLNYRFLSDLRFIWLTLRGR